MATIEITFAVLRWIRLGKLMGKNVGENFKGIISYDELLKIVECIRLDAKIHNVTGLKDHNFDQSIYNLWLSSSLPKLDEECYFNVIAVGKNKIT